MRVSHFLNIQRLLCRDYFRLIPTEITWNVSHQAAAEAQKESGTKVGEPKFKWQISVKYLQLKENKEGLYKERGTMSMDWNSVYYKDINFGW